MASTKPLSQFKILIVDDHLPVRQSVRNILVDNKIADFQMAVDGNECVSLVKSAQESGHPYDIVLLDWNLPNLSGLEVLQYFKTKAEHSSTAFVMLTAEADPQRIAEAIKEGAYAYIVKPFTPNELTNELLKISERLNQKNEKTEPCCGFLGRILSLFRRSGK